MTGTLGTNTQGHGIYVSGSSDGVIVRGNVIHDNGYIGIHVNGDLSREGWPLVTHALIEGNVIYNNGQNGINADGLAIGHPKQSDLRLPRIRHLPLPDRRRERQSNNVIVNNTIVGTLSGSSAALNILNASTGNTVLNNILLGGDGNAYEIAADSISGFVSDYNVTSISGGVEPQEPRIGRRHAGPTVCQPDGKRLPPFGRQPGDRCWDGDRRSGHRPRRKRRPSGKGYDIGAYELQQAAGTTLAVASESPSPNATGAVDRRGGDGHLQRASVQPSTISFVLKDPNGNTVTAQPVAYNDTTHTATLQPERRARRLTTYTATVRATNVFRHPHGRPVLLVLQHRQPGPRPRQ